MVAAHPRKLSPDEIEEIVAVVPDVVAACKETAIHARQNIQRQLARQLQVIKLHPQGIPLMKEHIIKMFLYSQVPPGMTVGITAAEAMGQPTTQMALNSFHKAGSSQSVSRGIEALREMFNMTPKRRQEAMIIHFQDKYLTFEEALMMRPAIVGVTVKDLTIKSNLLEYAGPEWWYTTYAKCTGSPDLDREDAEHAAETGSHFLRLELDTNLLFAYRITIHDVINAIRRKHREVRCVGVIQDKAVIHVHVPAYAARSDAVLSRFKNVTDANATLLMLQFSVQARLHDITIQGITGIHSILPIRVRTNSIARDMDMFSDDPAERRMHIWIDPFKQRSSGIPMEKFVKMLELCHLKILKSESDCIDIEFPEDLMERRIRIREEIAELTNGTTKPVVNEKNLVEYLNESLRVAEARVEAALAQAKKRGEIAPVLETPTMVKASYYVHATSRGTNLMEALAHPLIDSTRTTSNVPHEIANVLGIEAARNFIIREYNDIFTYNGSNVNPRHICIVGDFQTSVGLVAITARGVNRQNPGALRASSFENPKEALAAGAAFGEYREITSTAAAIMTGKRATIGTGAFRLMLDEEALRAARAEMEMAARLMPSPVASEAGIGDIFADVKRMFDQMDEDSLNQNDTGRNQLFYNVNETVVDVTAVNATPIAPTIIDVTSPPKTLPVVNRPRTGVILCPKLRPPPVPHFGEMLPESIRKVLPEVEKTSVAPRVVEIKPIVRGPVMAKIDIDDFLS